MGKLSTSLLNTRGVQLSQHTHYGLEIWSAATWIEQIYNVFVYTHKNRDTWQFEFRPWNGCFSTSALYFSHRLCPCLGNMQKRLGTWCNYFCASGLCLSTFHPWLALNQAQALLPNRLHETLQEPTYFWLRTIPAVEGPYAPEQHGGQTSWGKEPVAWRVPQKECWNLLAICGPKFYSKCGRHAH